jgi:branched-chain amino acid transport system substrate-binding protein
MKKRFLGLAALAALAVGADAQNRGTIKIVSQTPLSGGQSKLGTAIKNGVELGVQDFGQLVRAYGFRLVYEPYDDQANKDTGVANANRLINDQDVLAVVGHLNSGVAIPSSEVYARVNLTMVSPANTNPLVTDRRSTQAVTNRVCGRDDVQGPAGAEFVVNTLKAKRIYVINDKTAYGEGLAQAFSARAKALGAQVVVDTGIEAAERDFNTILNRAVVDKPDAVYYAGIYDQAGPLLKQMRAKNIAAAFVGGDGLDSSELQALGGSDNMKNVYFTTTSGPISSLPAARRFAERYKAKYNADPEGYSAYGYDATRVVLQGIANAIRDNNRNKPTRQAVARAVRGVKFNGITGAIAFNARGDLPVAKYFIVQAQAEYTDNKVFRAVSVAAPTPELK